MLIGLNLQATVKLPECKMLKACRHEGVAALIQKSSEISRVMLDESLHSSPTPTTTISRTSVCVCACLSEMDGFNPERGHLPCSQNSWQVTASRTGFVAFGTHRGQTSETCANMSASFLVTPDTHSHNNSTHIQTERERERISSFYSGFTGVKHLHNYPQRSREIENEGKEGWKGRKKTGLRWWIGLTVTVRSKRLISTAADW